MYENLKAIGFSSIDDKKKIDNILKEVIDNPNYRYIMGKDREEIFVEYIKYFGKGIGIAIRGSIDENENVVIKSWTPYIETMNKIDIVEVDIDINQKKEYYVICEEEQTGNEIVFYLQNIIEFLNAEEDDSINISGAYIVGLAVSGTILLPIKKDTMDNVIECEQNKLYKTLVKRVREGDSDAEQILKLQQAQITENITERLNNEDLFSVIEGYFFSDEEDDLIYNILGTIQEIEIIINTLTNENIYKFYIYSMGICLDICINEKNLLGMPSVGMRFNGKCQIQGKLVFDS